MYRFIRGTHFLVLAFVAACASAGQTGGAETDAEVVFVDVENDARADLDVSLVRGGQDIRLGRVQVGDQRRFRTPSAFLRTAPYSFAVRIVARDGSGSYTTPSLLVQQGQNVYIEASPTLPSSQFSVR